MRSLAIGLAIAAALGCRGKKSPPRAAPDDAAAVVGPTLHDLAPTASAALPRPDLPMPHQVRAALLEAGAAPRAVRRYQPAAETRELRIAMTITSSGFRGGAWFGPTKLPAVTEGFGVTTELGGATIALRGVVAEIADGDAAARAEAEAYAGRWRTLLERRRIAVASDARGQLGAITLLDDPAGALARETRDELVQRWLGLAVPLPAEAIGVGARWRVVTLLRTGGAVVKQTATYRLAAVDGDTWTIELDLARIGEGQRIDLAGLPGGVTAELIALRRAVKGTLTVAATSPLPRAGRLTSEASAHARFSAKGRAAVDEVSDDTAAITIESK